MFIGFFYEFCFFWRKSATIFQHNLHQQEEVAISVNLQFVHMYRELTSVLQIRPSHPTRKWRGRFDIQQTHYHTVADERGLNSWCYIGKSLKRTSTLGSLSYIFFGHESSLPLVNAGKVSPHILLTFLACKWGVDQTTFGHDKVTDSCMEWWRKNQH